MLEVFLFNRNLKTIPMIVFTETNMQLLNIGYNDLVYLPNEFGKSFPNLKQLYFNNNKLASLPGDFGKYLLNLEFLVLSNNNLKSVPLNFNKLKKIQKLYIDNNNLHNTKNFSKNLPDLKELKLNNNKLTSLPDDFGENMLNLRTLDLNNNQLSALPDDFGKNLPRLRRLNLSNNQITELPTDFVKNLPNLEELNINENKLSWLPDDLVTLHNLKWISITSNENEIANLSDIIQKINLQTIPLDIYYNKLEVLLKSNPPVNVPQIIKNSLYISNIYFINNYTDITVCNNYNNDDDVVFSSVKQIPLDKFFVLQLEQEANTTSFRYCLERDDYIPFMKNNVLANWVKNPNSRLPQIESMGYGGIPGNERFYSIPYVSGPAGEMKNFINQQAFKLINQPQFPYGITVFTLHNPKIARLGNIKGTFGVSDTHGQTVQTVWELKSKDILYKRE